MQNSSNLLSGNFTIISVEVHIIDDPSEIETSTEYNLLRDSWNLVERLLATTQEPLLASTQEPLLETTQEPVKQQKEILLRYGESDEVLLTNSTLLSVFLVWLLLVYPFYSYMYKKLALTHKKMQIFLIVNHFHRILFAITIVYMIVFISCLLLFCTGYNQPYTILYIPLFFPLTAAEVYQTVMMFLVLTESLSMLFPNISKSFKFSEKTINRFLLSLYVLFILTGIIMVYVAYYEFFALFLQPNESLKTAFYYPKFYIFQSAFLIALVVPSSLGKIICGKFKPAELSNQLQNHVFLQIIAICAVKITCFTILHNVIGNFDLFDECFICKQVDTFLTFLLIPITYLISFRSDLKTEIARLKMKKMIKNVYLPCNKSNKIGIAYNV